jgi:hypothetical protein
MSKTTQMSLSAALASLDPNEESHWTSGGLPRMEVLEALVGKELTRADVDEAAPDLKRSTAPELKAPEPQTETGNAPNAASAGSDTGAGQPTVNAAPEPAPAPAPTAGRDIGDGKKVGGIEGRVAELEADLAYLRKQFGWPTRSA